MGRRHKLTPTQRAEAARMIDAGRTYAEVGAIFNVDRSIVFRSVQLARNQRDAATT
jgi:hypothetical protein